MKLFLYFSKEVVILFIFLFMFIQSSIFFIFMIIRFYIPRFSLACAATIFNMLVFQ